MKKKSKKNNEQRGVTILIAILVLTSVIILAVAVAELVIRSSQTAKDIGLSEIAYYAADTAVEKALYKIEQNRSVDGLGVGGELTNGATWSLLINPVSSINFICSISFSNGLCSDTDPDNVGNPVVKLDAGKSFQLDLDFEGLNYPNKINFISSGMIKLVILKSDGTQNKLELGPGDNVDVELLPTEFVRVMFVRIINNEEEETSQVEIKMLPTGGNIPVGIEINATGVYLDQQRQIRIRRSNWQVY